MYVSGDNFIYDTTQNSLICFLSHEKQFLQLSTDADPDGFW